MTNGGISINGNFTGTHGWNAGENMYSVNSVNTVPRHNYFYLVLYYVIYTVSKLSNRWRIKETKDVHLLIGRQYCTYFATFNKK